MATKYATIVNEEAFTAQVKGGYLTLPFTRGTVFDDAAPDPAPEGAVVLAVSVPASMLTADTPESGKSTLSILSAEGFPMANSVVLAIDVVSA